MQAIIFIGIQASGKSSFYKENFFNSHVRISLDLLNTRNKQDIFLNTCFSTQSRFVVDNTNPTTAEREKIIRKSKDFHYEVVGYYFKIQVEEAIKRNNQRSGKEKIPELGIRGCNKRLIPPTYQEGFDKLFEVKIEDRKFIVREWEELNF